MKIKAEELVLELWKYAMNVGKLMKHIGEMPEEVMYKVLDCMPDEDFTTAWIGRHPNLGWFVLQTTLSDSGREILYIEKREEG